MIERLRESEDQGAQWAARWEEMNFISRYAEHIARATFGCGGRVATGSREFLDPEPTTEDLSREPLSAPVGASSAARAVRIYFSAAC